MSSKIVIKKPTASAVPKASAVVAAPSKVVVKAPSKVVVKAPQKVVSAPAKKPVAKIVHEEVEESEEEVQEEPMSRDEMLAQALTLLSQALGMKGGSGKIKLTKSGKIRKPRGPRENSEKQSAWMDFVKQVREEQGVDENGKFLISHKDAMKMAKQLRAEAGEEAGSDHTEEADEAPTSASPNGKLKKVVATKKSAAAPAKKSPQQIREELAAKKAAEEAAAAEVETEVEVEEFEHDGKNYLKNTDNLCWLVDEEGNQTWAGVYLPEEDRIDETAEEPMA